jgi:hypothetical protein
VSQAGPTKYKPRFVYQDHQPMSPTPRLAVLALILVAPAAAAAQEHTCTAQKYTTVCRDGGRELRIIRNTISPSGRYGVAWEATADAILKEDSDGSKWTDGAPADTFLVRLSDGKSVAKLAGEHFGDHARYNHTEAVVMWSPDSRYAAILNQSKWTTDAAEMYRMSEEGAPSKPLRLMPVCASATRNDAARRRHKGSYTPSMDVAAVANDGTITARCSMQVVKDGDYFAMGIRAKVIAAPNGLKAQLVEARLCGENDERGSCASREPQD